MFGIFDYKKKNQTIYGFTVSPQKNRNINCLYLGELIVLKTKISYEFTT